MKSVLIVIVMMGLLQACDSKPKVIVADTGTTDTQEAMADESASKLHKVVVEEILNTSKYTYLNVSEDGQMTWIAIPKKDVEKGGTYYYRGGLKKTNFKSVEHDRVFETLYLVSDVSKDPGLADMQAGGNPHEKVGEAEPSLEQTTKLDPPPGGITIAELFANRKKYEGQTVKIKGKCVKLNNMIMSRNWIHLQDGSLKDKTTDLTVTTTENVPLGSIVSFQGKITLNKDFGAGYKYEILMEEATLIQ
jgi:hypothetical protein